VANDDHMAAGAQGIEEVLIARAHLRQAGASAEREKGKQTVPFCNRIAVSKLDSRGWVLISVPDPTA
jgi:hypothetical protein